MKEPGSFPLRDPNLLQTKEAAGGLGAASVSVWQAPNKHGFERKEDPLLDAAQLEHGAVQMLRALSSSLGQLGPSLTMVDCKSGD